MIEKVTDTEKDDVRTIDIPIVQKHNIHHPDEDHSCDNNNVSM